MILWLDRWLANPLMQFAVSRKSKKVLGRLEALFDKNARKEAPTTFDRDDAAGIGIFREFDQEASILVPARLVHSP